MPTLARHLCLAYTTTIVIIHIDIMTTLKTLGGRKASNVLGLLLARDHFDLLAGNKACHILGKVGRYGLVISQRNRLIAASFVIRGSAL